MIRLRRLNRDIAELRQHPIEHMAVLVKESDMSSWFFQITGPTDTPFAGGKFYGRLALHENYPFSPPDYYMLTENGRFHVSERICLDNSSFHPETWSATWTVPMLLRGFLSYFFERGTEGYGHLRTCERRLRQLAKSSDKRNSQQFPELHRQFGNISSGLVIV
ncbi:MAG: ubiquitin-conjugating enzyme E2 [Sulfobacillus sp.]